MQHIVVLLWNQRAALGRKSAFILSVLWGIAGNAAAQSAPSAPANVAFYSAAVTVLLVCLFINRAIKNLPGIYYTVMFLLGLAFIWASDGGLSAMGLEGDTLVASMATLGMVTVAFGFFTAMTAFDPNTDMRKWNRIFSTLAIASLALIPFIWLAWNRWVSGAALGLFVASLFSHAVSTRTWKHHDETHQSMPVVASVLGIVLILGILGSLISGYGRDLLLSWDALKLAFAVVLVPTLAAVILALADVRASRDSALQEALASAQRDAETSANLLDMEKQYARAREVAFARSRQLSTASHDIGQPLAAIRAELDILRNDTPVESLNRLNRVLDHLEALTRSLSESSRTPIEAGLHGEVAKEHVEINLLFDTLDRLFRSEAEQAGIALEFGRLDRSIDGPPLILIRMLSNLIANALKHSGATRISIDCTAHGDRCHIEIVDNGSGFEHGGVDWAMNEGSKRAQSDGEGLGLYIVRQLSDTYELPLSAETSSGEGTRFIIEVPFANT